MYSILLIYLFDPIPDLSISKIKTTPAIIAKMYSNGISQPLP